MVTRATCLNNWLRGQPIHTFGDASSPLPQECSRGPGTCIHICSRSKPPTNTANLYTGVPATHSVPDNPTASIHPVSINPAAATHSLPNTPQPAPPAINQTVPTYRQPKERLQFHHDPKQCGYCRKFGKQAMHCGHNRGKCALPITALSTLLLAPLEQTVYIDGIETRAIVDSETSINAKISSG